MPLIQFHLSTVLTPDAKQLLVAELIEAKTTTLGADPKAITVILQEHPASNIRELDFVPREPG